MVTVGCQEALYLTLRALRSDDRDVLLAVAPSYVGVHGAAQLVDMPVLPVSESPEGIDLDDLLAVVRQAKAAGLCPRACYVIPDFANPSGVRLSLGDQASGCSRSPPTRTSWCWRTTRTDCSATPTGRRP